MTNANSKAADLRGQARRPPAIWLRSSTFDHNYLWLKKAMQTSTKISNVLSGFYLNGDLNTGAEPNAKRLSHDALNRKFSAHRNSNDWNTTYCQTSSTEMGRVCCAKNAGCHLLRKRRRGFIDRARQSVSVWPWARRFPQVPQSTDTVEAVGRGPAQPHPSRFHRL